MSFFTSISDIIASLSPRRQRHDGRQQQQLHQSSHHHRSPSISAHLSPSPTSTTHNRRTTRNRLQLSRGEDIRSDRDRPRHIRFFPVPESDCETTAAESQTAQSYANTDPLAHIGIATTRGQLRSPSPPSVIDLDSPTHWGEFPQMLTRGQNQKDAQDEARLLGAKYKDTHAVKIKPGSSLQNKKKPPGSNSAFRPTDRISRNSRESGPVRAQGKQAHSSSLLKNNQPRLGPPIEFADSNRPSKRQRHNDISDGFDLTSGEGNDSFARTPNPLYPQASPAKRHSRHSPSSSQLSHRVKNNSQVRRHDEYRQVEESVHLSPVNRRQQQRRPALSSSPEEAFTSKATEQRRSKAHEKKPREAVLGAIEVPVFSGKPSENRNKQTKSAHSSSHEVNGFQRFHEARESSDEIQGEVTTLPVPRDLSERHPQGSSKVEDQLISPTRKRSPADIPTTDFSRFKKKKRKPQDLSTLLPLEITYLLFGSIQRSYTEGESAFIYLDEDKIHIGSDIVGKEGKVADILLRNVYGVGYGKESSRKITLQVRGASASTITVDIEFSTPGDMTQLVRVLNSMGQVNIQPKSSDHMDKVFKRRERESAQYNNTKKRPLEVELEVSPSASAIHTHAGPRTKLSSSLQDSPSKSRNMKLKESEFPPTGGGEIVTQSREVDHAQSDAAVDIPVRKLRDPPGRATRSTRRTNGLVSDGKGLSPEPLRRSPPEDDVNRKKWKKPLVYPPSGKKRAEVSVEDRDRLRENEFLNDNLIAFYLRFLQENIERTNKSIAERVYFFNSYFYATLKSTKKGSTGINYSGVEKWTRNINLFEYDYIVVPINEDAHWYVAIICNLPSLGVPACPVGSGPKDDKHRLGKSDGVLEILESPRESPQPASELTTAASVLEKFRNITGKHTGEQEIRKSESPTSKDARQSFASISITEGQETSGKPEPREHKSTQVERVEGNGSGYDGGWPDIEENPQSSPPSQLHYPHEHEADPNEASTKSAGANQSTSKTKKKKKKQRGPKIHPSQPTIITFDSLDLARSSTVGILREYIIKEAESKRGVKINNKDLKGKRAMNIPLQPNWSDCGLYLLAYVEKFVQDPETFVTKLLQREMDAKDDWPPLGSGLLRHRLRKFLDDLYDEQTESNRDKPSMANQQPVSFLLGPPLPIWEDRDGDRDTEPRTKEDNEKSQPTDSSKDGGTEETHPDSMEELNNPDVADEDETVLVPVTPTKKHSAKVQIQVAATPPGSGTKKIRESPRAKHKN
ncbi:Peptidase C48 SUMO/Sentrin/Ubl1 [Penicillium angulare]|uniref:Peptidase C48 SUMO/Sentrin/Ubl1 n=1 Tax=Penicillium angulare TaxID=116970 RepID=UPI002541E0A7|nr:Peptidase C48 SUMO/Sentrin/Ubl1 [Penicillium angulare]KAJ5280327.1 Peptidase C48 SUMO/Sentrin/Ubl1 [Penicillium angulare]